MSQRNLALDAYLRKAPAFAQPIIQRLREVVHAACPEVEECIKWSCPFFVCRGPLVRGGCLQGALPDRFLEGRPPP